MIIIDPLKNRLLRYMRLGKANPRSQALSGVGSMEDIEYLEFTLQKIKDERLYNDARKYVYIDLTPPFKKFTRKKNIINSLNKFLFPRPVLMIKEGEFSEWLESQEDLNIPVLVSVFDKDGRFTRLLGGSDVDRQYKKDIILDLEWNDITRSENDLRGIRRRVAQRNLFNSLLSAHCIEFPRDNTECEDELITSDLGREYRRLRNDMLVSCYLNLKYLGESIESLLDVAYEAFLCIENYFLRSNKEDEFLYIITTNNTALFIASILQSIYEEKTIIPIDKLGPIPSLKINNENLRNLLKNKPVILFEEVVGTGSEVDRAIMFLNHMKADLKRIVTLYDLKVGKALLLNKVLQYEALCTPKEELKYEYRSA